MTPKQQNEVKRYVDIARKGGFAIIGQDNLKNYSKKLYLVLYTSPSKNLLGILKSIKSITDYKVVKLNEEEFLSIISIKNCKIIAFKNKAISDKILESMRGENIDK